MNPEESAFILPDDTDQTGVSIDQFLEQVERQLTLSAETRRKQLRAKKRKRELKLILRGLKKEVLLVRRGIVREIKAILRRGKRKWL